MTERDDLLHQIVGVTGAPLCKLRMHLKGQSNQQLQEYLETEEQICRALAEQLQELCPKFTPTELSLLTRRELDERIRQIDFHHDELLVDVEFAPVRDVHQLA